ncbi:MAG: hypothetical protein U9P68_00050 [Pseudomonadota bacterium]|nr:hypothetical protein [Pseudomonadota bacterium]
MTRREDPHHGDDGFHDVEPLEVSDAALKEIAEHLGRTDADTIAGLRHQLTNIAALYRNWDGRGPKRFTRGEAGAALEELLKLDRITGPDIMRLNGRAEVAMIDALWARYPRGGVIKRLAADTFSDEVLRETARGLRNKMEAKGGADKDREIDWLIDELAELYTDATQKEVTHHNRPAAGAHSSRSTTPAGQFITVCAKLIAVDSPDRPRDFDTRVSTALKRYIQRKKKK